jgi:hypothetical protein
MGGKKNVRSQGAEKKMQNATAMQGIEKEKEGLEGRDWRKGARQRTGSWSTTSVGQGYFLM